MIFVAKSKCVQLISRMLDAWIARGLSRIVIFLNDDFLLPAFLHDLLRNFQCENHHEFSHQNERKKTINLLEITNNCWEYCVISHFSGKLHFRFNYQNIDDSLFLVAHYHYVSSLIMHIKMANKLLATSNNLIHTHQYALILRSVWAASLQMSAKEITFHITASAEHSCENRWHNTGFYMRKLIYKKKRVETMRNAIASPFAIGQMPMVYSKKLSAVALAALT